MKQQLIQLPNSKDFVIESTSGLDPVTSVLPAVYLLHVHPESNNIILAHDRDSFEVPTKYYGEHQERVDDILTAVSNTNDSVGAILSGDKGEGKSLTAEAVCNSAISAGKPVIRVTKAHPKELLMAVHRMIGPSVYLFDEFNHAYFEAAARNSLLDFFADKNMVNCLFLITLNESNKLPDAFIHRPGRFLFHMEFKKPSEELIKEVIAGESDHPALAEMLFEYATSAQLNTDSLVKLIQVVNKFEVGLPEEIIRKKMSRLNIARPKLRNFTCMVGFRSEDYDAVIDGGLTVDAVRNGNEFTVNFYVHKELVHTYTASQALFRNQERVALGSIGTRNIYLDIDCTEVDNMGDYKKVMAKIQEKSEKQIKKEQERGDGRRRNEYLED
jgi:hypothetical protein